MAVDRHRCDLCWEEFDTLADFLAHMEAEEETIYVLDTEC